MSSRKRRRAQGISPKKPVGEDGRKRVADTSAEPWRWVCRLTADFGGERGAATGWLAGPRAVVTAAHALQITSGDGGRIVASSVEVEVAFGAEPRRFAVSTSLRIAPGFGGDHGSPHDYAVVVLDAPLVEGAFAFGAASDGELSDAVITLAGFPLDKSAGLYRDGGALRSFDATRLTYALYTGDGQSGGPIWIGSGSGRRVIGLHAGPGDGDFNIGVRLTDDVVETLRGWM